MAESRLLNASIDGQPVEITTARAVVKGKTYAVKNITSVAVATIPASRLNGILLAVIGAAVLFFASGSILAGRTTFEINPGHVVGLILFALGVALAVLTKAKYAVKIHTAGVEQDMLVSTDYAAISRVVEALNRAIIGE